MEKLAIETRKQQEKPDVNCAPLVQVVCIAVIFIIALVEQILKKSHYNASIMLECSAVTKMLKEC